ncbi:MAG: sodium/solute symporter [Sedimentisphaeraceae bacterium JB056]
MSPQLQLSDYLVLSAYVLGIVLIGLYFSKKGSSTRDYLLAGRNIPWLAASLSLFVALFSAISFVSMPGEAYKNGIRLWLAEPVILCLIPLGMWMFVRFYYKLGSFTPYEYIERRFSSSVRAISSILFLMTRGLYLAIVLYATSKIFSGAAGWSPVWTITGVSILVIFLTTIGGMKAVVWTNVVQFFVLVGGAAITAVILASKVDGGFSGVYNFAFENGKGFNMDKSFFQFNPYERVTIWWLILAQLGAILSQYATDQITIQQLLTTKNYKEAKRAAYSMMGIGVPVHALFWFLGLALFCFYHQSGKEIAESVNLSGDEAFAYFVSTEMFAPLPGLVMAGLLAAVLSTLDSGVKSLSTVINQDIYVRFFLKDNSEKDQMRKSHYFTLGCGVYMMIGALVINWASQKGESTVFEVSAIWQSLNGIVLAIFILGVMVTSVGRKTVFFSSVLGLLSLVAGVLYFYYLTPEDDRISFIITGNIGLLVTLLVGVVCGFFYKFIFKLPADKRCNGLTLWSINNSCDNNDCDSERCL